jgi:metal-responsive CopG/Arc/MetJ family transcriptional regulator
MARLSISLPDELLKELGAKQVKYQSFSGFCCFLLEKGLEAYEREQEMLKAMNHTPASVFDIVNNG